MTLVFLDTETTGLDPAKHEIWEVAFSTDGKEITTYQLIHDLATADPMALALNGYFKRYNNSEAHAFNDYFLKEILVDATIVGSNPAFDAAFLRARWCEAPWKHRLIAIETMAFTVFKYELPKGMKTVADDVRDLGYDVPEPDHTAAGDVRTLIAVYNALRELA